MGMREIKVTNQMQRMIRESRKSQVSKR
jgi:hypothetical protein